jgi:hypothetical protein
MFKEIDSWAVSIFAMDKEKGKGAEMTDFGDKYIHASNASHYDSDQSGRLPAAVQS